MKNHQVNAVEVEDVISAALKYSPKQPGGPKYTVNIDENPQC